MSREDVESLRKAYAAWNEGDRQFVLDYMTPDFEWVTPADDPDPGTHSGHEGVRRYWDHWQEAFGRLRIEIEEMIDAGDKVVAVIRRVGVGKGSGIEVEERVNQVFTFREGKGIRCEEYYDRNEALVAAGLQASGS